MDSAINIRTNHQLRLKAFDLMQKMKKEKHSRQWIVNNLHVRFDICLGTLYEWYRGNYIPYGRRGKIIYKPELFYILGALLGDGCLYKWRITNHYVILVGDKSFASKYANLLTCCTGVKARPYIDRNKNIYFVRTNNYMLYELFEKSRYDIKYLGYLLRNGGKQSSLLFAEGFFDAEGCVKVIREKTRPLPKICLDITNTNLEFLELVKIIFKKYLNIDSRYSTQKPATANRKITYHLRIYKKAHIREFFKNLKTTKLKNEKIIFVKNWLNLADNSLQLVAN